MHTPLITMLVVGLGLAFVLGAVANRLKLSPLVGYLVAGIVIGPFTPGYVADQAMARQLAEVGVILLMFGSGLHFSLADLLSVRKIAIPGAVGQMTLVTLLGLGVAYAIGWPIGAGHHLRPRAVGLQHGGRAALAAGKASAPVGAGPHGGRLAGRAGHRDDPRPHPAAGLFGRARRR